MDTGVITPDTLSQVLRDISQKRRQGSLEIICGDNRWNIAFHNGKIVEAILRDVMPVPEVIKMLVEAGHRKQIAQPAENSYRELFLQLNETDSEGVIDEELFRRVIQARVLNTLYQIDLQSGAYYNFKLEMADFDRDFSPAISVGGLLLDLVALETDQVRFHDTFPEGSLLRNVGDGSEPMSEEETILWMLMQKAMSCEKLEKRALLSRFHLQDALLSLHERGLLQIAEGAAGENGISEAPDPVALTESLQQVDDSADLSIVDDIVALLEDSIDASFSEKPVTVEDIEAMERAGEATSAEVVPSDEDEWEDEEDYEDFGIDTGLRAKLHVTNLRLLHSSAVPLITVAVFLLLALLIPYFYWREVLTSFTEFYSLGVR